MTLKVKKRLFYFCLFSLLTCVEILIALFVHDNFIRPYVGDIIIVMVIYCFIRIFEPKRIKLLPLFIFIFAFAVEVLQLFHIASLIGIKNRVLKIIIGSNFDTADILCYLIGCALLAVWEYTVNQKQHFGNKKAR